MRSPVPLLLLVGLAASPGFGRPINPSLDQREDPMPVLVLPPSVLKHTTPSRVTLQPTQGLIIPLLNSDSDQGATFTPAGSVLATTLTIAAAPATQTVHVVAGTMTVTVTVKEQPATPTTASPESSETDSSPVSAHGNGSGDGDDKPFMATYFPDWTGDEFPPEKVDFNRFKWVDFAFAVPDENRQLKFESNNSEDLLKRLVSAAHSHGSKVKLSVGGWTGSRCFSDAVSNDANRREFVKNIVAMYHKFNLDGIDIDWEYPGVQGAGSNKVSPSDSAHFLLFLQHLRSQLPEGAKITAATQVTPFAGPDGAPMKDVSGFAKVLDWILIMNYDVWGASSTPGPNAPLRDGCHNSTQPDASAAASVKAWTSAGLPANQITLGLPSYGYVQTSTARQLVQRSRGAREGKLRIRQGDDGDNSESDGGMQTTDSDSGNVRVKGEGEGDDNGQVQFEQLLKEGAIKLSFDGNYVGTGGFSRLWDTCSSTPYLVSKNAKQVVTYDDPESLGIKAAFAKEAGLRGVNMFDVHGDTDDWVLTDAIRAGLGLD